MTTINFNQTNNNNNGNSVFTPDNPTPIGQSCVLPSDKVQTKNARSMVKYEMLREYFLQGEPKFITVDGKDCRIVWTGSANTSNGDFNYTLAVLSVEQNRYLWIVVDDEGTEVKREIELFTVTNKLKSLISAGVTSSENQLYSRHTESIRELLDGDDEAVLVGSSDDEGNITFTWADILYILFTKGSGRGRKASYFKLEMDEATLKQLLAHPDFKDKVKIYVKPVKEEKK